MVLDEFLWKQNTCTKLKKKKKNTTTNNNIIMIHIIWELQNPPPGFDSPHVDEDDGISLKVVKQCSISRDCHVEKDFTFNF